MAERNTWFCFLQFHLWRSKSALYQWIEIQGQTLGLNYIQSNNGAYTGPGVGDGLNPNTISSAAVDDRTTYHWTLENILPMTALLDKHAVNAVALYSAEQSKYNRSNMAAT